MLLRSKRKAQPTGNRRHYLISQSVYSVPFPEVRLGILRVTYFASSVLNTVQAVNQGSRHESKHVILPTTSSADDQYVVPDEKDKRAIRAML